MRIILKQWEVKIKPRIKYESQHTHVFAWLCFMLIMVSWINLPETTSHKWRHVLKYLLADSPFTVVRISCKQPPDLGTFQVVMYWSKKTVKTAAKSSRIVIVMLDFITMIFTKAVIALESYWNPGRPQSHQMWAKTLVISKKTHSILLNKNFQCSFHFYYSVVILFRYCILVILSLNFF